jgi:NADH dehydrogenase
MKVLVTGATGFVGREVLRQLGTAGYDAIVLARNPDRARAQLAGIPCPTVVRQGDVLDASSLCGAADGCEAVIHLVGIISEIGRQTFENVHFRATQNLIAEAKRAGVGRWVHMSALGVRPNARSRYHQTKWAAEEVVRGSGLAWTIFRPSIIYGPEDHFVNLFAGMARLSPVLPVMGSGQSMLQPIPVTGVARCFVGALTTPASVGKTFDVCGPAPLSFDGVVDAILEAMGRHRWKVHVPMALARVQAALLEQIFPRLLRRAPPLNRDQLMMLQEDNVGDGVPAARLFGFEMEPFAAEVARYLQAKH